MTRTTPAEVADAARDGPSDAGRAARHAPAAGPRRQGAGGLERSCAGGLRRRDRRPRGDRRPARRRASERLSRARHGRRRAAPRSASGDPTDCSAGAGRTAGRRRTGSSRITPSWPKGSCALYGATFDERWFVAARGLADTILARFVDPAGGFFDTSDAHETLVVRPKDLQDNAVPSGNAMATTVLLELSALTGDGRYRAAAERALGLVAGVVGRYPSGFAQWLVALDFAHADVVELAIVGAPTDAATGRLLAAARTGLSARSRGRLRGRPGVERDPAARGAVPARRATHRVRLPPVRLSPAGGRAGGAGGPARRMRRQR